MANMTELMKTVTHSFEFIEGGLPELKPYSFVFQESLSAPYILRLDLTTKDPSIDEAKLVGQACTLTLNRGGMLRYINGLVTSVNLDEVALNALTPQGQLPRVVVQLVVEPAVTLLGQRRDMRIFQNETVPDIIKKVLSQGLQDYGRKVTMKATKRYEPLEYCTQYDETDLDFVLRLMGEAGLMWYFKQGEKEEELVVFDDVHDYQPLETLDHQPVPFETSMGDQQWVETVSIFRAMAALGPTAARVRHFNWSVGSTPEGAEATGKDALHRTRESYLGEGPVRLGGLQSSGLYQKSTAQAQATLARDVELSRQTLYEGEGAVTGLSPGVVFELTNSLREDLNRKYLVTKVEHHGRPPAEEKPGSFAGNQAEVLYTNHFFCVAKDVLYRLPAPARRQVQTMQTALVVGDEDITTDVHGRIKVQFHWDRQGKNDRNSSCWMRVAQSSAGVGFGCVFIPRKGQEVVVSFIEGDPDKPLVVGTVYNGINVPPYQLPDKKTRSVIRTRSTPNGSGYNELSFEDAKGAEEVYIQAEKDMKELVKHDHEVLIKNDERLTVEKNQTEDVGKDQSWSVGGNRTRSVKKDEAISVGGNRSLSVKKNDSISVDGTHEMAVTKAVTQTFSANHTLSVAGQQSITVEKGKTEHISKEYELTTDKKYRLTQGDTTFLLEGGKVTLKAGGAIKIYHDSGVVEVTAGGDIKITGGQKVTIDGGGSKLTLKSGKAVLDASQVDIGS